jgi:capsular polysaccharide biosynthesis protein
VAMTSPIPGAAQDLAPVEPLVSLRYIMADLRRRRRVWAFTAAVGLIIGLGFHLIVHPTYRASTTLILAHDSSQDPTVAMQTDVVLATARPVAQSAAKALQLPPPSNQLLKAYTVVSQSPQLLKLTAEGASYHAAVQRANAIASAFLAYRAAQFQAQNQDVLNLLNDQIKTLQGKIDGLNRQLAGGNSSSTNVTGLVNQQTQYENQLTQYQTTEQADTVTMKTIVGSSKVLNGAVPIHQSAIKVSVVNGITGLIGGIGIGLLLVVIPCLVSDRLRSRFDVARALETPVQLSVPRTGWLGRRNRLAAHRIADYLYRQLAESSSASLAVVAVHDPKPAAEALVLLAERLAADDRRVLLTDLTESAILARWYGIEPSGGIANTGAATGAVTVGRPVDSAMAVGPLELSEGHANRDPVWRKASSGAELVLSLAELDPGLGADHLAEWALEAVVVVNAGRSSGVKIQAVGNMLRQAGLLLRSGILLDADPQDDTSGNIRPLSPSVEADRYPGMANL